MATQNSASRQALPNTHSFFRTLPRELRDNIYDLLHQDVKWDEHCGNFCMYSRAPITALRLVNRQFKLEYKERILQKNTNSLVVDDYGHFQRSLAKCPNLAAYTAELTLSMFACNGSHDDFDGRCDSVDLLPVLKSWIDEFVTHLSHLRTIRIGIAVFFDSCIYDTLLALGAITTIPKVVEVTLGPIRWPEPFERSDNDARTLATWTPQRGMVHNHEGFKQCMREGLLGSWFDVTGGQGTWDGKIFPL